jgi:hypothetical protein
VATVGFQDRRRPAGCGRRIRPSAVFGALALGAASADYRNRFAFAAAQQWAFAIERS